MSPSHKNPALYFNGFYLFNPKETNQTLTRGVPVNTTSLTSFHSVADQFAARLGLNYAFAPKAGLSASLGGRIQGIPSHDLIGGDAGFRRPGYVISIEPGLSYNMRGLSMNLNIPVALYRNRTKSVSDLSDPAGQRHGDAAFADYLINFLVSYKLGGMRHETGIPARVTIPNP